MGLLPDLDGERNKQMWYKYQINWVVHSSKILVIFSLVFDISLPKIENDPKMKPKMSSKMVTMNNPNICYNVPM